MPDFFKDLSTSTSDELEPEDEFDSYLTILTDDLSELPPLGTYRPTDPLETSAVLWIIPDKFNGRLDNELKSVFDLLSPRLATDIDQNHLIDLLNQVSKLRP